MQHAPAPLSKTRYHHHVLSRMEPPACVALSAPKPPRNLAVAMALLPVVPARCVCATTIARARLACCCTRGSRRKRGKRGKRKQGSKMTCSAVLPRCKQRAVLQQLAGGAGATTAAPHRWYTMVLSRRYAYFPSRTAACALRTSTVPVEGRRDWRQGAEQLKWWKMIHRWKKNEGGFGNRFFPKSAACRLTFAPTCCARSPPRRAPGSDANLSAVHVGVVGGETCALPGAVPFVFSAGIIQ